MICFYSGIEQVGAGPGKVIDLRSQSLPKGQLAALCVLAHQCQERISSSFWKSCLFCQIFKNKGTAIKTSKACWKSLEPLVFVDHQPMGHWRLVFPRVLIRARQNKMVLLSNFDFRNRLKFRPENLALFTMLNVN